MAASPDPGASRAPRLRKLYHSISEVAALTGLDAHVLRYWEQEFDQLRPRKNRAGHRAYTEADIAVVQVLKRLLREERYTLDGARSKLVALLADGADLAASAAGPFEPAPPAVRPAVPDDGAERSAGRPALAPGARARLAELRAFLVQLRDALPAEPV